MLPTIAIFVGALIIITRLPLVIWPDKMKDLYGRIVSVKPIISFLGLFMVGLGVFIAYAAWTEDYYGLEFVIWIIGALSFVFGVLYVVAPVLAKQIWDAVVVPRGPRTLRALGGIGVLIGLFILILGFVWLDQLNKSRPAASVQRPAPETAENSTGSKSTSAAALRTELDQFKQNIDDRLDTLQNQINQNNDQIRQLTEKIGQTQKSQR